MIPKKLSLSPNRETLNTSEIMNTAVQATKPKIKIKEMCNHNVKDISETFKLTNLMSQDIKGEIKMKDTPLDKSPEFRLIDNDRRENEVLDKLQTDQLDPY